MEYTVKDYSVAQIVNTLNNYAHMLPTESTNAQLNKHNLQIVGDIDDIRQIVSVADDEQVLQFKLLLHFVDKIRDGNFSALDGNIHAQLQEVYNEVFGWFKDNIKALRNKAVCKVRIQSKKRALVAVVILSLVAVAALALGVLAAFGVLNGIWCDIIGVLDCVFGLSFFIYEFCDDKLKVSQIQSIDEEQVEKGDYQVLIHNINSGIQSKGSFNKIVQNVTINYNRHTIDKK